MKRRRRLSVIAVFVLLFCLCGCNGLTADTDQLIRPPQLTGEMKAIGKALSDGIKGSYTLKYPTAGDRRSAIITEDVDGDGILEAFAFYGKESDKTATVSVAMIRSVNGKWQFKAHQTIEASAVERVEFCDLDGSGYQSVLIGFEVFGSSEKQLAVYHTANGKLTKRMLQQYTDFLGCDLDEDGKNEIFVQSLSPADGVNRASLFALTDEGITERSTCLLDQTVKAAGTLTLGELSSGQPAVYVDEIKGTGAITEVLFLSKGHLVNPLLDTEVGENTRTLHNTALKGTDMNEDGVLEIPISIPLTQPVGVADWEQLYLTGWYSFNGERLDIQKRTAVNTADGYYITIPDKWAGKISLKRDTDAKQLTVYAVDGETQMLGNRLADVRYFPEKQWKEVRRKGTVYKEICRTDDGVFGVLLDETSENLSVSLEDFRKLFAVREW